MAVDTLVRQKRLAPAPTVPEPANSEILEWEASDQADQPRNRTAWLGVVVGGVLVVIVLALVRQWLGALVVIFATVALLTTRQRDAHTHRIRITESEITIDNQSYPYPSLHSFWLTESEEGRLLHLEGAGRLGRLHQLPLGQTSLESVRSALQEHLSEETGRAEDLSSRLARWLRL